MDQCELYYVCCWPCGHEGCLHDFLLLRNLRTLCLEHDFMWLLMRRREHVTSLKFCTRCCCAYCAAPGEHETDKCIFMQYSDEEEAYKVYQTEYPSQGNCKSKIQVSIMNSNIQKKMWALKRWEIIAGFVQTHIFLYGHRRTFFSCALHTWSLHAWLETEDWLVLRVS